MKSVEYKRFIVYITKENIIIASKDDYFIGSSIYEFTFDQISALSSGVEKEAIEGLQNFIECKTQQLGILKEILNDSLQE